MPVAKPRGLARWPEADAAVGQLNLRCVGLGARVDGGDDAVVVAVDVGAVRAHNGSMLRERALSGRGRAGEG